MFEPQDASTEQVYEQVCNVSFYVFLHSFSLLPSLSFCLFFFFFVRLANQWRKRQQDSVFGCRWGHGVCR